MRPNMRVGWSFTQGGGLGGLALGYYQAAPLGLRNGEADAGTDSRRPLRLRSLTHLGAMAGLSPRGASDRIFDQT